MVVKEYYCNKCGREMDEFDIQEELSIQSRLGYGSRHDGDMLQLDLCCECMDELIDSCKISPLEAWDGEDYDM